MVRYDYERERGKGQQLEHGMNVLFQRNDTPAVVGVGDIQDAHPGVRNVAGRHHGEHTCIDLEEQAGEDREGGERNARGVQARLTRARGPLDERSSMQHVVETSRRHP